MGGSGSYFGTGDPNAAREQVQKAREQSRDSDYLSACNGYLGGLLTNFNDRDVRTISGHLKQITEALGQRITGEIDLMFGGSAAKSTFVNGLSDIDALLLLDDCELSAQPPGMARAQIASALREHFGSAMVTEGALAITVNFGDIEIQLVPAVSCRAHFKISDSTGENWSGIRPQEFAQALTTANERAGGKLIPTVKLAKALVGTLPEHQQVTGYHAEALAIAAFKSYAGPFGLRDMLRRYFAEAARLVLAPIRDSTGQSINVDETLGPEGSLERKIVSDAFARVARRMANADASGKLIDWQNMFEPA